VTGLHAETAEPREHRGETIEIGEDGVRLGFRDEPEGEGRFDGGCSFIALGAGASKALAPIVAVTGCGFGQVEIGAEERAPHLVAEWAVPTRELADQGVSRDESASSDMKCVKTVMRETSRVHESLLARSAGL
jgi:hypothetical protein